MGFFSKKPKPFLAPKPNNSRQIFAAVEFKPSVHERFQPRIKRQTHTRIKNGADESAAMIEGWNSKHLWKHVYTQPARRTVYLACRRFKKSWACELSRTPTLQLARCVHVPAAACVEECSGLEWLYFSPLFTLSLRGQRNIWLRTIIFPSDWDSSWDLRKLSLRLSVYLLCCFLYSQFSSHPLLTSRQKKCFPPKLTKICSRTWIRGTTKIERKSSTFN